MQYLVSHGTAQTTYMWGTFQLMLTKYMEKKRMTTIFPVLFFDVTASRGEFHSRFLVRFGKLFVFFSGSKTESFNKHCWNHKLLFVFEIKCI